MKFMVERVVVFDVETTGLYPERGDRIIEIGAVAVKEGTFKEEFHSLIYVERHIPMAARKIHGISDAMIEDKPRADEVILGFRTFIGDSVLVAHNARFDVRFLKYEFARLGLRFRNSWLCTKRLAERHCRGLPDYRLDTVYQYLFGELPDDVRRHRAMDDARLTADVWMELVRRTSDHHRG